MWYYFQNEKYNLASDQQSKSKPDTLSDQWQHFMLIWAKLGQVKYKPCVTSGYEGNPFPLSQQLWDLLLDQSLLFTERNFHFSYCCWWDYSSVTCQMRSMSLINNDREIIPLPSESLNAMGRTTGLLSFYLLAARQTRGTCDFCIQINLTLSIRSVQELVPILDIMIRSSLFYPVEGGCRRPFIFSASCCRPGVVNSRSPSYLKSVAHSYIKCIKLL